MNQQDIEKAKVVAIITLKLPLVTMQLSEKLGPDQCVADHSIENGSGESYGLYYRNTLFLGYQYQLWKERNTGFVIKLAQHLNTAEMTARFTDYFKTFGTVQTYKEQYTFLDISTLLSLEQRFDIIEKMVRGFFES